MIDVKSYLDDLEIIYSSPAPARIPSRGKLKTTKNPAFAGFSFIFF